MKKRIAEILRSKKFACGFAAIALTVIIGGAAVMQQSASSIELPVYDADPIMEVSLEEEETPLASAPTTTTKTTKKTSKKNVKLSKAATKTYSVKLPTTSKTTTKTASSSTKKVTTKTTVSTAKTEKYTKKSKVKVVTTTVTTTVKTTTTQLTSTAATVAKTASSTAVQGKYEVSVSKVAPKADSRVLSAFQTLGFKVYVDSSVSYSGLFDASTRSITLKSEDDTIYHELGHFLAFIAGNADKTTDFKNIYAAEKNLFTGANKAYATQNSSEYFAESFKNYTQNAALLKSSRPKTYSAIVAALNKVTTAQVTKVKNLYSVLWK